MADNLRKKLFRAINKTDIKMLRAVLRQGVNLDTTPDDSLPVMLEAVNYGHEDIEILDELLQYGADVNASWQSKFNTATSGATALHWVVNSGRPEVLNWFIQNGADLNACNEQGLSPFNACIKYLIGRPEEDVNEESLVNGDLQTLMKAGADIFLADKDGNTPLHYAAFKFPKIVHFLLGHGANIQLKNSVGKTPLRMAVEGRSPEAADVLLNKGANPNAVDNDGDSPLNWAASKYSPNLGENERRVLELLIKAGADVNTFGKGNVSPLCWAAMDDKLELADILIAHDANLDFNNGEPLQHAIFFEYDDFVIKLLQAGARTDLQNPETLDGAIHFAAAERYLKGTQILHQYNANMELCNIDGETPLCIAARRYADEVAQYLVDSGANVNHTDLYGNTPLFWARRTDNKEMETLLLKAGAKEEETV